MPTLVEVVRVNRDAIVAAWEQRVRELPGARSLEEAELRDEIPQFIDRLANAIEREETELHAFATSHGRHRYAHGAFDLAHVVTEFRELRQIIVRMYRTELGDEGQGDTPSELRLHDLLDTALAASIDAYYRERERERNLFVSILGHDLRNPLGTISVAADQLRQRGSLDPQETEVVGYITRASTRMRRILENLLEFARTRLGGRIPTEPGPQQLDEICQGLVDELRLAHPDRDLQLGSVGDVHGAWDRALIEQAVTNLLDNGIRHGGDPICVRLTDEGPDQVAVEVSSGGAVPETDLEGLFDPMRTGGAAGTGLGLFVVREVARAHGGTAVAENRNGRVVVAVRLPRHAKPNPRPNDAQQAATS